MILWLELCKNEKSTVLHIQRYPLKLHKHGLKLKCALGRHSSRQMYYEESPPNLVRECKWEMETDVIYPDKAPYSCPEDTYKCPYVSQSLCPEHWKRIITKSEQIFSNRNHFPSVFDVGEKWKMSLLRYDKLLS